MKRPAMHGVRAHAAIAAELVRLCLCGRPERPELLAPVLDDRTQHKPRRVRKGRRK